MLATLAPLSTAQLDMPRRMKRSGAELDGEQPLAKRFDLMNINGHGNRLYLPVAGTASQPLKYFQPKNQQPSMKLGNEFMEVEDTKDRVFIHDLDRELAELESDEEHPIFLSDIEKHLIKIPKAMLTNDEDRERLQNMQLVLYNVPSSLSVPAERDSVRKAIIDSRRRATENQHRIIPSLETSITRDQHDRQTELREDPDAMDIS